MISGSSPRVESLPEVCAKLARRCGGFPVRDEDSAFALHIGDGESLDLKFYFGKRESAMAARSLIESSVVTPEGWRTTIDSADAPIRPPIKPGIGAFEVEHRTGTGVKWLDDSVGRAVDNLSAPSEKSKGKSSGKRRDAEPADSDEPAPIESTPEIRTRAGRPPPKSLEGIPDSRLEIIGALTGMLSRNGFRNLQDPKQPNSRIFRPAKMEEDTHDVEIRAFPGAPHVLLVVNSACDNHVVIDQLTRILSQKKHYGSTPVKIVHAKPGQESFSIERRTLG